MLIHSAKYRNLACDVIFEETCITIQLVVIRKKLFFGLFDNNERYRPIQIFPDVPHGSCVNPKIYKMESGMESEFYFPGTFNLKARIQELFDKYIEIQNQSLATKENIQKYKPKNNIV